MKIGELHKESISYVTGLIHCCHCPYHCFLNNKYHHYDQYCRNGKGNRNFVYDNGNGSSNSNVSSGYGNGKERQQCW